MTSELLDGQRPLRFFSGRLWAAWVYPSHVLTVLADGRMVRGTPPDSREFLESSVDLGYGEDVYWHMMEHDLLHSILSERLWNRVSVSLSAQASDRLAHERPMGLKAKMEEEIVGAMQGALWGRVWAKERLLQWDVPIYLVGACTHILRSPEPMTSAWAGRALGRPASGPGTGGR